MKKERMLAIVIIFILLGIIGIWFLKQNENPLKEGETIIQQQGEITGEFALQVKDQLDLEELKKKEIPIMLDFGAESCGPCRQMKPALKIVHRKMEGKAFVKYMDVWENQKLGDGFPIQVIPTQFFFEKDGSPLLAEKVAHLGISLEEIMDQDGNHILTRHVGILTENQMLQIFEVMGVV